MKKYIIMLSITIFSIIGIGFSNKLIYKSHNNVELSTKESKETTVISQITDDSILIARELNGYVAIYKENNNVLLEITDIYVNSLTPYDQNLIKKGLTLDKEYTLEQFIEDFDS